MDIFDYPKREAQIKKRCFTKLFDFTNYYLPTYTISSN